MFLKNYTSNVPVSQTIYKIEQVLIRCGVSGISKEYTGTNGKIQALIFKIEGQPPVQVRLPADVDAAWTALWLDYAGTELCQSDPTRTGYGSRKKLKKADFREQAERTAWKIMQDWVEVQMSMIQLKQAEPLEVFLPYAWNGQRTFYQELKASQFRALLPAPTEHAVNEKVKI